MTRESHDHNFKNLFLDFPEESLQWLLPSVVDNWGPVRRIEFVRQEPRKRSLSDRALELDLPIMFTFEHRQLLLWLVEFQEDKAKFSIYKLLRYTTDMMEAYPEAVVIPTVLFTDRKKWRKSALRKIESRFNDRLFLYFEYEFVKLFDFKARDYYNIDNPVVKILLPKMDFKPEDRIEVIRQAYQGLFRLASAVLFDKYLDFIDAYAGVGPEEQEAIYREITEHKETAMLAQYIKEKGRQEGQKETIVEILRMRFGKIPAEIVERIDRIDDPAALKTLLRKAIQLNQMDPDKLFS